MVNLAKLAVLEPQIDVLLRRFLARGYDLKSVADYAIGPDAVVTVQEAIEAIDTATRFVDCVAALLAGQRMGCPVATCAGIG